MRLLTILGVGVGGALLALLVMLIYKAQLSKDGSAAGLERGYLTACSVRPNCVRSEEGTAQDKWVEPLRIEGGADQAWRRLQAVIESKGGDIQQIEGDYLAATFTSALFGFVDDLEARLDRNAGVIHLRSASRVGHSDLGANRTRVMLLRQGYK